MNIGAQPGNLNRAKGRAWRDALYRALEIKTDELGLTHRNAVLDLLAMKLIDAAMLGEQWALREFADRIEGKPEAIKDDGGDENRGTSRLFING